MRIDQAHALVTGASRGLGARVARRLADEGAVVTLVARSADQLRALADEIDGHVLVADLADPAARDGLVARAAAQAGPPVTILVNNAGIDMAGHLPDMTPDDLQRLIAVNVTAPAELARQAIPGMLGAGGGSIVNVSSLAGVGVFPGLAAYSATKAALTHLSAGLRADLRGLPIAVTTVETGLIVPTDMAESVNSYPPTRASFHRFRHLLPDTDADDLADAIAKAVAGGRRHVRRPVRAQGFSRLVEMPRRITEWMLAGVPPRVG